MPIKLLKHKSYHVNNAKNIERVRRDEEEARTKEEERNRENAKLERSSRLEALRAKNKSSEKGSIPESQNDSFKNKPTHKDINAELPLEHEKGYEEMDNVYREDIVSLMMRSSKNSHKNPADSETLSGPQPFSRRSKVPVTVRESQIKASLDPLAQMEMALSKTHEIEQQQKQQQQERHLSSSSHRESSHRRHGSHKSRRRTEDSSSNSSRSHRSARVSKEYAKHKHTRKHD